MRSMRAGEGANSEAAWWFVEPDSAGAGAAVKMPPRPRARGGETDSASVIIVSSLFLALVAAALLVGGHVAIDPLLQSAITARENKGVGDIVYTMPDGVFCRRMAFDNVTAEITERPIERCRAELHKERPRSARGFAWGAH